ncbi:MAG: zinc ribbon domain-containing protein [Eubacteriales bacterium]|nr:zinc ribbon domain-containing protein [Eubacteriales bacterium]
MKNRQVGFLFGISGMQVVGIVSVALGIHTGIVLIAAGTALLAADAAGSLIQSGMDKVCPKCKASIPKKSRICPECGHRYQDGIAEDELTEYIEREKEKDMTSEKIDHDFEKMESVAIDELMTYDGDIEDFLRNRCKEGEI